MFIAIMSIEFNSMHYTSISVNSNQFNRLYIKSNARRFNQCDSIRFNSQLEEARSCTNPRGASFPVSKWIGLSRLNRTDFNLLHRIEIHRIEYVYIYIYIIVRVKNNISESTHVSDQLNAPVKIASVSFGSSTKRKNVIFHNSWQCLTTNDNIW